MRRRASSTPSSSYTSRCTYSPRQPASCSAKVAVDRTLSEAEGLDAFRLLQTVPMTSTRPRACWKTPFGTASATGAQSTTVCTWCLRWRLGGRVVTADRRLYDGVHGGPLNDVVIWVTDPL